MKQYFSVVGLTRAFPRLCALPNADYNSRVPWLLEKRAEVARQIPQGWIGGGTTGYGSYPASRRELSRGCDSNSVRVPESPVREPQTFLCLTYKQPIVIYYLLKSPHPRAPLSADAGVEGGLFLF